MLWRLINFADRNPQAALFEGAEFLAHEQMRLGTKAVPILPKATSPQQPPETLPLLPDEMSTDGVQSDQPQGGGD
jgi:hypothetical protein